MKLLFPKTIFIIGLLVLISCADLSVQASSFSRSDTVVCDTFPPPRNLEWLTFDNTIKLWWEAPHLLPDSIISLENLYAYAITKDGAAYDTLIFTGEDTTEYYDNLGMGYPTSHEYYVSAIYDLTFCGSPGEFGESIFVGPVTGYGFGGFILSFIEDWNTGSFDPNFWTADEKWVVDGANGNPYPSAKFSCVVDTSYSQELISYWLDCNFHPGTSDPYVDGDFYLEFDIALDRSIFSGVNYLDVSVADSLEWVMIEHFPTDTASYTWTAYSINITEWVKGKMTRIKFTATGGQAWNIHDWYIDNIYVYRKCNPPRDLHWVTYDELMAWSSPIPHTSNKTQGLNEVQGYNVYYENSFLGFTLDTFYAAKSNMGTGNYYVTAIYEDCEPSSNYIYGSVGTEENPIIPEINIYPNPCNEQVIIESNEGWLEIQLINPRGEIVLEKTSLDKNMTINTSSYSDGMYFLKLTSQHSSQLKKLLIRH